MAVKSITESMEYRVAMAFLTHKTFKEAISTLEQMHVKEPLLLTPQYKQALKKSYELLHQARKSLSPEEDANCLTDSESVAKLNELVKKKIPYEAHDFLPIKARGLQSQQANLGRQLIRYASYYSKLNTQERQAIARANEIKIEHETPTKNPYGRLERGYDHGTVFNPRKDTRPIGQIIKERMAQGK